MKPLIYMLLLSSSWLAFEAKAQFRCQGSFVDNRYSKLDVQRYCGEPLMKDSYTQTEKILVDGKEEEFSCSHIDQWYYSIGVNKTTYVVEFEAGFVVRVVKGRDKP